MGTAAAMLVEARKWLGTSGRPNALTRAYSSRHGEGFLRAAWCDIAVTEWARHSDNEKAVLPSGDRAYTVWHAQDFQKIKRWYKGTTANVDKAKPGDIVFFDWGNTDDIAKIDHVGIVEKNLGNGTLQTIEGNTGDVCKRRIRYASSIAGYGRPAYEESSSSPDWMETMMKKLPTLKLKDRGEDVQTLQGLLQARSKNIKIDGYFGASTEKAVKEVQEWGSEDKDGVVGPKTWPILLRVHK